MLKFCTVVGFPLGATTSAVKAYETKEAIQNGTDEIDMVINVWCTKIRKSFISLRQIIQLLLSKWRQTCKGDY